MAWDCGEQQRGGPANRSTSFTDPTVHVSETMASRALCLYTFLKRRRPVRCVHQDPEPVRLKCVGHVVSCHPLISVEGASRSNYQPYEYERIWLLPYR